MPSRWRASIHPSSGEAVKGRFPNRDGPVCPVGRDPPQFLVPVSEVSELWFREDVFVAVLPTELCDVVAAGFVVAVAGSVAEIVADVDGVETSRPRLRVLCSDLFPGEGLSGRHRSHR